MESPANNFNFVAGVFGFVVTIASAALCCRAYLPGTQMKILDELLKETRSIYEKANADNLFPSDDFREVSLITLTEYVDWVRHGVSLLIFVSRIEESSASLRESTYNARTTFQEYVALFRGLSRGIIHLADCVKDLQACLISTSERERRQRQVGGMGHSANNLSMSDTLTSIDSTVNTERSSRAQQVGHSSSRNPTSCSPALNEPLDSLRESLVRLGEVHSQDVDQVDTSGIRISSDAPETINDLNRPPTPAEEKTQNIFCKTLDRLSGWMRALPDKGTPDASVQDYDISGLLV